jgi:hypothetical protein
MKKILAVAMLLVCFAGTVMADGSGQSPPKKPTQSRIVVISDSPINR